jgi:beta-lactam-binding protein with PASTA domain
MKRLGSSLIVLGLLTGLLTAAVGTASAQIAAEAQLGVLNGASNDPVSVTINGQAAADGLEYAASPATFIGGANSYAVSFSDGSSGIANLGVGEAGTMVSGYGEGDATAMLYPIEVAPIDAGMAKFNVSNTTDGTVKVAIDGEPTTLDAGASLGVTQVAAGTTVTVTILLEDPVAEQFTAGADSYTDAFVVNDTFQFAVAFGTVASMTDLIAAITAPEPTTVPVPDVVGQPQADAELAIAAAGLVAATSLVPHDTVEAGLVINTDPGAGTEVAIGSQVAVNVSTGPPPPTTVAVPDVVGDAEADAVTAIEEVGLTTEVVEEQSETVEVGLVIETNPRAGTEVAVETLVTVTVSGGPGETTVPDFSGMTSSEAQAAAEDAGLVIEVVLDPEDPDEDGIVVDQDPEAGTTVDIGSTATVLLSPLVQDAWTIVKVDFNRVLTTGGLRFQHGSVSEATVLGTTLTAKAVVDDSGYWIATIDLNALDGSQEELLVTGTAADGSAYEQLFTIPEAGDTTDEVVVEETGFPTWGWIVLGIALLAVVLLIILLITGGPSSGAADDSSTEAVE